MNIYLLNLTQHSQEFNIIAEVCKKSYDYPFSTPAENAVNKRIIERLYANHLKFCKTAVFVVCQRDNHEKVFRVRYAMFPEWWMTAVQCIPVIISSDYK